MKILSAHGLSFLDIISYPELQLEENIFTFITGESGCGKSTLLKFFNKTLIPSSGKILYRGNDIQCLDTINHRRNVLLLPQEVFLFHGTIYDNFKLYYANREEKCISENDIEQLLSTCCLNFPLNTECSVLSGGERQRVFLAIYLSFTPDVLLLDEPTSALDENTSKALLSNVKAFCNNRNITPVAVCHSKELVKQFSDCTIELRKEANL